MGTTTWEWEGLGILKAIPAHLYFAQSLLAFLLFCYFLAYTVFFAAAWRNKDYVI